MQPRVSPLRVRRGASDDDDSDGGHQPRRSSDASGDAGAAAAAQLPPLPLDAMDVDVFERRTMRILTSLRRLSNRAAFELDVSDVGRRASFDPATATDAQRAFLWTLTRRVTRRVEKLRVLHGLLDGKRAAVQRALAREAEAARAKRRAERAAVVSQLQQEAFFVDALQGKIAASVAEYDAVATHVLGALCKV